MFDRHPHSNKLAVRHDRPTFFSAWCSSSASPHPSSRGSATMNSATIREDAQHRLHSQLLRFLPKELADEVLRHHAAVTYAKDSIIFLQGSPADLMFWIMSGLVKLYCPRPDGNRTLVRLCGPGDVLGYADLIDTDHRHLQAFEAQTLTKCTIALFTPR